MPETVRTRHSPPRRRQPGTSRRLGASSNAMTGQGRHIRLATAADAAAIAGNYAPFCESSAVSFEYHAPSAAAMATRIAETTALHPWLVLIDGDTVAGYAYASRHRERAAYAWCVDTAVYVGPDHLRQGVGTALYARL